MLIALNILLSIIATLLFAGGQSRFDKMAVFIVSCFITPFLGIPFMKLINKL